MSGTIMEALRSGNTGCRMEKCRYGMIRDVAQAQAGTGDPTVIHSSPTVSYSSANLEMDKPMGNKEDNSS